MQYLRGSHVCPACKIHHSFLSGGSQKLHRLFWMSCYIVTCPDTSAFLSFTFFYVFLGMRIIILWITSSRGTHSCYSTTIFLGPWFQYTLFSLHVFFVVIVVFSVILAAFLSSDAHWRWNKWYYEVIFSIFRIISICRDPWRLSIPAPCSRQNQLPT